MPIRAVLFDFDGTLADSYRAITASVNHVRAKLGQLPMTVDEVRRHVGRGLHYLLGACVPGTDLERDAALYLEHHPKVLASGTELYVSALPTLRSLRARGLKLAICSNKPVAFTRTLAEILKLADLVDQIVGPEDVDRPKPAPDMLIEAMNRLGVSPAESIYVGDMTIDIQTARAAKVTVWVVPTGSDTLETLQAANPDRFLTDLADIANSRFED